MGLAARRRSRKLSRSSCETRLHELLTKIEDEPGEPPTLDVDQTVAHRLRPYEDRADRLLAPRVFKKHNPKDPRARRFFLSVP